MSSSDSSMDWVTTSQSSDPSSSPVLVGCEPSTSWQAPSQPTLPPMPPPPPPPPPQQHQQQQQQPQDDPIETDSDDSFEICNPYEFCSFGESVGFYKFRRNILKLRTAFTTIEENTAIEFISIKYIENNFRSNGLNKKFDKNNVMESQIEFKSFESWFVHKKKYVAAKNFISSIRLPLFCHLYLCLYSDHNRQLLHLFLNNFKYLFLSSKGVILLEELKSVTENQKLPIRLRAFRRNKFVYQVSPQFFFQLCNFFKNHYMIRAVFQEWFDIIFTFETNPFIIYEDYYNKTIVKVNNLLKANAPKMNNNECPINYASNPAILSKKKLNSSQNQNNIPNTTNSKDDCDDDQRPSTSKGYQTSRLQQPHSSKYQSNNDKKFDDQRPCTSKEHQSSSHQELHSSEYQADYAKKLKQPQNMNNGDKNNIEDNQRPFTRKEHQSSSHEEYQSSDYQSDDDKAGNRCKTTKKYCHSKKSKRNESVELSSEEDLEEKSDKSAVKKKHKKHHKNQHSSCKRKHKSHKKRRRGNNAESIQENESTCHQDPQEKIMLRIGKSKDNNSMYYIKKNEKDTQKKEESFYLEKESEKKQEGARKEEEIQDENKVKKERLEEVKKEIQENQSRYKSIDEKEFDESEDSISRSCSSDILSEDSSDYYSSDSSFYDEEAALRKYVEFKYDNLDQDLQFKSSLFLKTEKTTKIDLHELEEDPHLCITRQIVLPNCNRLSCTLLTSDHRHVAAGSSDSIIYVWERSNVVTTVEQSFDILNNIDSEVEKKSYLPANCSKNFVEILDKSKAFVLRGHGGPIYDLAETNESSILLSASNDKTFRAWNLESKLCLEVFDAYKQRAWCISACPYTLQIATGSCDGVGLLWFLNYKNPLRVFTGHSEDVLVLKFHPNQSIIASGSSDKSIRIFELVTGDCQRILVGHKDYISCLEFHPLKPNLLASASGCGEVILWNINSSRMSWKLQVGNVLVSDLSWSSTDILLAALTTGIVLKCDITKDYRNSNIKVKGFSTSFNRLMHLRILNSLVYTVGIPGKSTFHNLLKIKQAKRVSKQVENEKDLRSQRETSPLSKLFFTKNIIENVGSPSKHLRSLDSALLNDAISNFSKINLQQSSFNLTTDDVSNLIAENQSENVRLLSKSAEIPTTVQNTLIMPVKSDVQMTDLSTPQQKVQSTYVQLSQESHTNIEYPSIIIPESINNVHFSLQTPTTNVEHEFDTNNLTENVQPSQLPIIQDPEVQKTSIDSQDKHLMPWTERLPDDLINSMLVPLTEQQRLPHSVELHNLNDQHQQGQQFQPVDENNTNSTHGMVQQLQPNTCTAKVQVDQPNKFGVSIPLHLLNRQSYVQPTAENVPQQLATVKLPNVNVKRQRKQQLNVRLPSGVNVPQMQTTVLTTNAIPQQQQVNIQSPSVNVSQRKIIVQTTTAMPHAYVQSPSINVSQRKIIIQTTTAIPHANVQSPSVNISPSRQTIVQTNAIPQQPQANVQSTSVNNSPQTLDKTVSRHQINPKSFPSVQAALKALSRPINSSKSYISLQDADSINSGRNNK